MTRCASIAATLSSVTFAAFSLAFCFSVRHPESACSRRVSSSRLIPTCMSSWMRATRSRLAAASAASLPRAAAGDDSPMLVRIVRSQGEDERQSILSCTTAAPTPSSSRSSRCNSTGSTNSSLGDGRYIFKAKGCSAVAPHNPATHYFTHCGAEG